MSRAHCVKTAVDPLGLAHCAHSNRSLYEDISKQLPSFRHILPLVREANHTKVSFPGSLIDSERRSHIHMKWAELNVVAARRFLQIFFFFWGGGGGRAGDCRPRKRRFQNNEGSEVVSKANFGSKMFMFSLTLYFFLNARERRKLAESHSPCPVVVTSPSWNSSSKITRNVFVAMKINLFITTILFFGKSTKQQIQQYHINKISWIRRYDLRNVTGLPEKKNNFLGHFFGHYTFNTYVLRIYSYSTIHDEGHTYYCQGRLLLKLWEL